MLPELLDNGLRSPNNNTGGSILGVGFARNRASLCLSPVTGTAVLTAENKRRSWCGTPTTAHHHGSAPVTTQVKRYGELGHCKPRSDAFLEPYFQLQSSPPSADQQHQHIINGARRQAAVSPPPQSVAPVAANRRTSSGGGAKLPPLLNRLPSPPPALPLTLLSPTSHHQNSYPTTVQHQHHQQQREVTNQFLVPGGDVIDGNRRGGGGDGDYNSQSASRESLVSSNGGGSDGGSEDSGDTGYGAACDIGLVERLRRSHPIWFLPGIQRAGAFHLLQGKEEGCFVVRQSSQSKTMALSVRLPPDRGPYIEHYLIQSSDAGLGLETSENRFPDMPALIAHYANCCDELPVQLTLPKSIREATSQQQLSSLALLGSEFWRYSPPPSAASSPDADLVLNFNPLMSTFKTAEPCTPTGNNNINEVIKPAQRPNTLNLNGKSTSTIPALRNELASTRTPPPPPPRWSKPTTPQNNNFTVTTTFTISVNPDGETNNSPQKMEVVPCNDPKQRMSPEGKTSTLSSKGSLRRTTEQILSPSSSILSPNSDPSSILSPDTLSPLLLSKTTRNSRRGAKHKASKHYQESDILESPTVYYRSNVGDKISDYEDVWTNENSTYNRTQQQHHLLASPDLLQHTTGNLLSNGGNPLSPTETILLGPGNGSKCNTPTMAVTSFQTSAGGESCDVPVKQSSPFYAEPADSLSSSTANVAAARTTAFAPTRVYNGRSAVPVQQRHSNPVMAFLQQQQQQALTGLERIESSEINGMSSSVDNLSPKQRNGNNVMVAPLRKPEVKPVLPPSVKPKPPDTWQVDNGWKFMGNECDINMDSSDADYDNDWPATIPTIPLSPYNLDPENSYTMEELLSKRLPCFQSTTSELLTDDETCRMSSYDNVDDKRIPRAPPSEISELTEFSDPWNEISHGVTTETDDSFIGTPPPPPQQHHVNPPPKLASISRSKSFKERLDPVLTASKLPCLRNNRDHSESKAIIGAAIRNYALDLANDKSTTFAQNIDNFIACTCESKEINPQIIMRNMRQFMSGMKNYLVKHGEKEFNREVEKERNKLKSTEFLNLDAILEGVLHKLVVKPLKSHLHKLFVDHYTKSGAIRLLSRNIKYASTRTISELSIKPKISLPSESALETISDFIKRLQVADSPLEKLEFLLAAIATIFNSVKTSQLSGCGSKQITLGADDFLPIFVWVLVKTNFETAEIEADYMWGLLHPSLLSGEGGYYLTTLSSAVHVLKSLRENSQENLRNNVNTDVSVFQSVLKVVVPDELHGSILTKTLPARPHMTTREVCKIIAHKAKITNPQDFALYRLEDGEETILADNECPQDFMNSGKHVMLAYKRIDAKIAWPRQQQLSN